MHPPERNLYPIIQSPITWPQVLPQILFRSIPKTLSVHWHIYASPLHVCISNLHPVKFKNCQFAFWQHSWEPAHQFYQTRTCYHLKPIYFRIKVEVCMPKSKGYRLKFACQSLKVTGWSLKVVCRLHIAYCRPQVAGCKLHIASNRLQVVGCILKVLELRLKFAC